ncbi:hypothetical protein EDC04DRAFT_2677245, partial [Pisolithus marmoratus]
TGLCFLTSTGLRFLASVSLFLTSTGLCLLMSMGLCLLTSIGLRLPASTSFSFLTSMSLRSLGFFLQLTYSLGCLADIPGSPLNSELSITFPSPLSCCLACGTFARFPCTARNLLSFPLSFLCFLKFPLVPLRAMLGLARGAVAHVDGISTSVSMQ